jgi:hypothetical protein
MAKLDIRKFERCSRSRLCVLDGANCCIELCAKPADMFVRESMSMYVRARKCELERQTGDQHNGFIQLDRGEKKQQNQLIDNIHVTMFSFSV